MKKLILSFILVLSLITPILSPAQQIEVEKNAADDSTSFNIDALFSLVELVVRNLEFREAIEFSDAIRDFLNYRALTSSDSSLSKQADSVSKVLSFLDLELGNVYYEELSSNNAVSLFNSLGDSHQESYKNLVTEVKSLVQNMRKESAGVHICKIKQYEQPVYTGKEGKSFVDVMYPEKSTLKEKEYQYFGDEYKKLLRSATFKIIYEAIDLDGYKNEISGHCCLYENDEFYSYLMLPLHVFDVTEFSDFDSIFLISSSGKSIALNFYEIDYEYIMTQDAEMLKIPRLNGFSGLRETIIGNAQLLAGDSVELITPFNINGIAEKSGIFTKYGEFQINEGQEDAEPGDSGAPLLTKNGVKGVAVAIDPYGTVYFTPVSVFEKLYISFIFGL